MNRISISIEKLNEYKEKVTVKTGQWFDLDKATTYNEHTKWNGKNQISKATGVEHYHECLYVTKGGLFILNSWSNWQGSPDTYIVISKKEAGEWFAKNEYNDEEIPEILLDVINTLEV